MTFVEGVKELHVLWLGRRARAAGEQGNLLKYEQLTRQALAIMEHTFGEVEQTATYVFNLADALAAQGKFAEAKPQYQRGLSIDEVDLGKDHPRRIARYLFVAPRLGSVMRELGDEEGAAALEAQAASIENSND